MEGRLGAPSTRRRRVPLITAGLVGAGAVALVPALVPHDIHNAGPGLLRVLGFFSSAAIVSIFDETLAPFGSRVLTLGAPDVAD